MAWPAVDWAQVHQSLGEGPGPLRIKPLLTQPPDPIALALYSVMFLHTQSLRWFVFPELCRLDSPFRNEMGIKKRKMRCHGKHNLSL